MCFLVPLMPLWLWPLRLSRPRPPHGSAGAHGPHVCPWWVVCFPRDSHVCPQASLYQRCLDCPHLGTIETNETERFGEIRGGGGVSDRAADGEAGEAAVWGWG